MAVLKRIENEDIDLWVDLLAQAYPGLKLTSADQKNAYAARIRSTQEDAAGNAEYVGLWRDGVLMGGMRLQRFRMNMRQQMIPVSGVGMVAVDFLHKKQHIGKSLIELYLRQVRQAGSPIAALYAFRTDFYCNMGFGFGPKMHRYRIPPARFPKHAFADHVRALTVDDATAVHAFYQSCVATRHGLMEMSLQSWERILDSGRIVGCFDGERLEGYLAYHFRPAHDENFVCNDLVVDEWLYQTPTALRVLMGFLASQADQIQTVWVDTQDEDFHHLITDARNGTDNLLSPVYHETNSSGVGLMYRIVDVAGLFNQSTAAQFGKVSCRLRIRTSDSFLPENDGTTVVWFADGKASLQPPEAPADVEIALDVSALSSLVMGVIHFKRLMQYGQATISDPAYTDVVHELFWLADLPMCTTGF